MLFRWNFVFTDVTLASSVSFSLQTVSVLGTLFRVGSIDLQGGRVSVVGSST